MADKKSIPSKFAYLQNLNNENNNNNSLSKASPPSLPVQPTISKPAPVAVSSSSVPKPPIGKFNFLKGLNNNSNNNSSPKVSPIKQPAPAPVASPPAPVASPSAPIPPPAPKSSSIQPPVIKQFNFLKNLNNNSNNNSSPIPVAAQPATSAPSVVASPPVQVEEQPAPVEAPPAPVEAPPAPVEAPPAPVEAPPAPVEAPPAPVEAPLAPVEAPLAPVEAPPAPVEAPPAPIEAPLAPVEAPPAPVKEQPAPPAPPAPIASSPALSSAASTPSLKRTRPSVRKLPSIQLNQPEAKEEPKEKVEIPEEEPVSVNITEPLQEEQPQPPVIVPINEAEEIAVVENEEAAENIAENVADEEVEEEAAENVAEEEAAENIADEEEEVEEEEIEEEEVENENFNQFTNQDMLQLWDRVTDFDQRDVIIRELERRKLFPSKELGKWEFETGAYPDIIDPEFLQKLLLKREFAESLQKTWEPQSDPCEDNSTFEVTPVQRFVANFMSPKTPYMSCLLYHGVGVGKTCAGIQICEAWLGEYPYYEVFLVAPPTIQQGFFRTIFDITKVTIGKENDPNTASQCTGDLYMRLTNTLYERDPVRIERLVNRMIRRRYKVFGYGSFANYIKNILKDIPPRASEETKDRLMKEYIRKEFSGKLLVIDEAHNLRDIVEEKDESKEEDAYAGGKAEKLDSEGGKKLTPYIRFVLKYAESMKLCLLTATPMYNNYKEIIFILNLLLMNDKKAQITETEIFDSKGNILEEGKERLEGIAQRYVSFMRGENPISFPIRLFPENIPQLEVYPTTNPRGVEIKEEDKVYFDKLPIVPIELSGDTLKASLQFMRTLSPSGVGLSTMALDKLVHAGNIVMPETESTRGDTSEAYLRRTDANALSIVCKKESSDGEVRYRAIESVGANWLVVGNLKKYSPKFDFLIRRIRNSEGCIFVYTRFVSGGALPLALALEANGYIPYGRKTTFLANGIQAVGGRQCALCPKKEREHTNSDHSFSPAYYGLLTGDNVISPNNEQIIRAQRSFDNVNGVKMKIIIGSQIASEGVDLRFIRETHVIDSWYHLNKTEQILGRAIRYLSHCALPQEKRNNTVYLYAATLPQNEFSRETGDLYSYRVGFKKAVLVGNVTRIMKQSAIDCNLNKDAIVIKDQDPVRQEDSQRMIRENVNINDMPFTAVCDWIETCEYQCKPQIEIKEDDLDDSTYDEFSARWRVHRVKERFKILFSEQAFYQAEDIWNLFTDIPRFSLIDIMNEIINNKSFQVTHGTLNGYIRYCNGYYIFQPNVYHDLSIPLAIRIGKFPIKRDLYRPVEYELPEEEEEEVVKVDTLQTINEFWLAIYKWVNDLASKKHHIPIPGEIELRRIEVSQDDQESLGKYSQIIEVIQLFHESFHKSQNKNPDAFRKALLFYFWDEWLSFDEQKFLIYESSLSSHPSILECTQENQFILGKYLINRFLNPDDDSIIYLCEKGNPCQRSFVDIIEEDESDDPLKKLEIIPRYMGNPYGFLASKDGKFVFKTAEPNITGKIGKGSECGIVTTMTKHIAKLITIGDTFKKAGYGDFNLSDGIIARETRIKNSTRACTLLDLCIRLMDSYRISNKRWFLRPLQAYYTGHKGKFRSSYKK